MDSFCMTCHHNFDVNNIIDVEYDGHWYEIYFKCYKCMDITQVSSTDLSNFPDDMQNFIDIFLSMKELWNC